MRVIFRVDSSVIMGSGHVMRCLTLADELRYLGAKVSFICRELQGNMCKFINRKGYEVFSLPYFKDFELDILETTTWFGTDLKTEIRQMKEVLNAVQGVDWLILDHYAADIMWEKEMRPFVKNIMVIDDLANREHDCDLLLDQNLYQNMAIRYKGLLPKNCLELLGPEFALLRPEFREFKRLGKTRAGEINRVLVFFGGTDPTNETSKTLEAIKAIDQGFKFKVDVVVGQSNPNKEDIKRQCLELPLVTFYCQVENMAELMARADLAIGAGGVSTWERCCVGLPSLIISVAKNQVDISREAAKRGVGIYIGPSSEVSSKQIFKESLALLREPEVVNRFSKAASDLVDGLGATRVGQILSKINWR